MDHDEAWWKFRDTIRSFFYTAAPVVIVASIFAVGWAKSIESRVNTENFTGNALVQTRLASGKPSQSIETKESTNQIAGVRDGDD